MHARKQPRLSGVRFKPHDSTIFVLDPVEVVEAYSPEKLSTVALLSGIRSHLDSFLNVDIPHTPH